MLHNSGPLCSNIGILVLNPFKHCYSGPMLSEDWNSGLFLYKGWNSGPTLSNIGIPALSFQTLEPLPCPFKHFNSGSIFISIGILSRFFLLTLDLRPCHFKHGDCGTIFIHIGIPVLSFQSLEFPPYPFNH